MKPDRGSRIPDRAAAFAPATVSNVGCGFDVLGFALEQPGDVVIAIPREQPGIELIDITGDGGRLPRDALRNTATVAAAALLGQFRSPSSSSGGNGVGIIIKKGMPLASGMGSSGASAVAAVLAVNDAFDLGASTEMLLRCAMEGERASAGAVHPDNVAPSLVGGFVLARGIEPPDIVRLPVPQGLACAVLHPAIEIETRAARAILPATIPLADAVRQWANVGALVAALHAGDLDLLGRAMIDHVVERHRAHLVPGFAAIRQAAVDAGAIGANLSGAGPAMFALCRSLDDAHRAGEAMRSALAEHGRIGGQLFVSRVATSGARLVDAVD
jgi:homoserine kinase